MLVSVILPVFNSDLYLKESIDSILNQTYQNFELIIINDNSTDNSKQIIFNYTDNRINYYENLKNEGLVFTLNRGLKIAKGDFIARMDADDISLPFRFKKQVDFLNLYQDIDLIGSNYCTIDKNGKILNRVKYPLNHEDIKFGLLFNSVICHPSIMFRRQIVDSNIFVYKNEYFPAEDYYLWTTLVSKIKIRNIDVFLLFYRIHDSQISKRKIQDQKLMASYICVYYLLSIFPNFSSSKNSLLEFMKPNKEFKYEYYIETLFVYNSIYIAEENIFLKSKIKELLYSYLVLNYKKYPFMLLDFKKSHIYKKTFFTKEYYKLYLTIYQDFFYKRIKF
jgi:glycosyltransferase involved in cell wall biosynthesis